MFDKEEVKIFVYHNGYKHVASDPIEIQINLEGHEFGEDIQQLFEAVQAGDMSALQDIIAIGRVMFKIDEVEVDPETGKVVGGLTGQGVMGVMTDFILFMEELKKNIDDTQIGQPSTDSPEPTSVTSALSECGQTPADK